MSPSIDSASSPLIAPTNFGYDVAMAQPRNTAARLIAGAIALGGTPEAFLLAAWPFEIGFPRGLLVYLVFSPGWFAFLALVVAAMGKQLPGDPFTTWIPCLLVNGSWLVTLGADTDFDLSSKAYMYFYVRAYVLASVVGSAIGLYIELKRRRADRVDK
jgi:hypothetical protein